MTEVESSDPAPEATSPGLSTIVLGAGASREAVMATLSAIARNARVRQSALYVVSDVVNDDQLRDPADVCAEGLRLRFAEINVVPSLGNFELAGEVDLLLVSAGVTLPVGWDSRLRKGAMAEPRIGALGAIDDATAPFKPAVDSAMDLDAWDAALFCLGDRALYDTPRFTSACLFLRRTALEQVASRLGQSCSGLIAQFEMLQPRLAFLGWRTCLIDFCAVATHEAALWSSQSPEGDAVTVFGDLHPLRSLAGSAEAFVRSAPSKIDLPGFDQRPVVLHLLHSWGGGIRKWVEEFSAADSTRVHLMLVTVQVGQQGTQRVRLCAVSCPDHNLRHWDLSMPIRSIAPGSLEYERILQEILRDYSVDAIVVSSLIGHALSALEQDVRTIVVCHDYLPICQSIFPYFERECPSCSVAELGRCRSDNPLNTEFKHVAAEDWDALRNRYVEILLARRPILVAPSRSVIEGLRRLDGRLSALDFHLVPHGLRSGLQPLSHPLRGESDTLRLAVLGRVNLLKGEKLLREFLSSPDENIEVTLVGCGPKGQALAAELGVKAIAEYQPGNLREVLGNLEPHAGLLLSSFPETFSYTLSELQSLAIPPIATKLGAFAERIRDGESGLVFEPRLESLRQVVDRVVRDPGVLAGISRNLVAEYAPRTVDQMVKDYSAWLPSTALPYARFPVSRGRRTALHADYVHLSGAYLHLREGYEELDSAYRQVNLAYQSTLKAYEASRDLAESRGEEIVQLRDRAARFFADVQPLGLKKRWWRAPRALRMVEAYREDIEGKTIMPGEPKSNSTPKT